RRIGALLARAKGRVQHVKLDRVSPLAVPALIEEGREWVAGGAEDALLAEAAALVDEATGGLDRFMETLADLTEEVPVRGERDRPRRGAPRRSRFVRTAPKSARAL
ncbi:MAG: DNA ligase-associated DEXH box helicase, partial [Rubritepida sp.]|nr:DNA ligase-associated DEXH box helicase [Rubritepida sp.]